MELIYNILITLVCFLSLGFYFNRREKRLQLIAESKLSDFKDHYLDNITKRKLKERQEIEKLKTIVIDLETRHKKLLTDRATFSTKNINAETDKIIKTAEERGQKIEAEMRQKADKFLEDQKREVQGKMVDLVMGVTKKILAKSLSYNDHKELIESAVLEMDGEETTNAE
ncbi:MAG: hypothetical protein WCO23_01965 [bacterium]